MDIAPVWCSVHLRIYFVMKDCHFPLWCPHFSPQLFVLFKRCFVMLCIKMNLSIRARFVVESWHRVALYLSFCLWLPAVLKIFTFFFSFSLSVSVENAVFSVFDTVDIYWDEKVSVCWSDPVPVTQFVVHEMWKYNFVSSVLQNKIIVFLLKLVFKLIYF